MLLLMLLRNALLTADVREGSAECAEYAANAADSALLLVVRDWPLASEKKHDMSAMSASAAISRQSSVEYQMRRWLRDENGGGDGGGRP
jgi:hypothetical protein